MGAFADSSDRGCCVRECRWRADEGGLAVSGETKQSIKDFFIICVIWGLLMMIWRVVF